MGKVRIRLQGAEKDVAKLRKHLLKHHPQMILKEPYNFFRVSTRTTTTFVFGDYEFNKIRRRRNQ
jgi:hypothetical protein